MVFSTPVFLFLFLPVVLGAYFVLPRFVRNAWLLFASLFFYAWGEQEMVLVMLVSIAGNFGLGLLADRRRGAPGARTAVALAVAFNIGLLGFFKYANFLWDNLGRAFVLLGLGPSAWPDLAPIHLPIGISFFAFQGLSYVIDIHRGDCAVQRNPVDFAMYKSFFPQLIAGPIVRYRDIAAQVVHRTVTRAGFAYGIRRFAVGLGKKMLVANIVAEAADKIFAIPAADLTGPVAWLGLACYTLQIYFDFSGYSDMAIGLGHMFGFRFLENFNYPYVSASITEFWRRWHISLSTWFRDYLYIPLGGNRRGPGRTYFNLILVFFLCGLWHGASWSFVVWGLYHGVFLVLERLGLQRAVERVPVLSHAYVLLVVMIGWVFFRADHLGFALEYVVALFGLGRGDGLKFHTGLYLDSLLRLVLAAGAVGAVPILPWIGRWRAMQIQRGRLALDTGLEVASFAGVLLLLVASAMQMAAGTYNPFIYFRF